MKLLSFQEYISESLNEEKKVYRNRLYKAWTRW